MSKMILTLAMLGNVPTKESNPATPVTPEEVVKDIVQCSEPGISIAHIHARDENEKPSSDKAVFEKTLSLLNKSGVDVITQLSTGARGGSNTVENRGQMLCLKPEMASLSTGSSNFPNSVNANSPELIEALAELMRLNNIKPEIEVFDAGMLDGALSLIKRGVLKTPVHFNLVMGVQGSIAGTPRNLMFLREGIPDDCTWSVCGIGRAQVPMITMAMLMGGHVRTGLEDTILYEKGVLATNKMLVERVHRLAREFGRQVATPGEAREILSL
jgi:3-keto-5-aminohexanoate cleavage enzyme